MSRRGALFILAMDFHVKADEMTGNESYWVELMRLSKQCQALAEKQPRMSVDKSVENPASPRFFPCPISCT